MEAGVFLVPLFIVPRDSILSYLICVLLVYFIYKTIVAYDKKIKSMDMALITVESENQKLSRKVSRLGEFEKEKELLIKLKERNRIAGNLHDELGHTITGSIIQLEAVKTIIREDPEKADRMISRISSLLSNGMNSIRKGLKSLKPDHIIFSIQKVKELIGEFEKNTEIRVHLKTNGDLYIISPQVWSIILSHCKEGLTNTMKHSNATHVYIEIEVLNRIIKAGIKDNGTGSKIIKPGMGLTGMEERTREAGGILIIDNTDGFSIIMIFNRGETDGSTSINSR